MWRAMLAEFEGEPEAEAAIAAFIDAGAIGPDSFGEEIEGNPTIVMWSGVKVAVVFPGDPLASSYVRTSRYAPPVRISNDSNRPRMSAGGNHVASASASVRAAKAAARSTCTRRLARSVRVMRPP